MTYDDYQEIRKALFDRRKKVSSGLLRRYFFQTLTEDERPSFYFSFALHPSTPMSVLQYIAENSANKDDILFSKLELERRKKISFGFILKRSLYHFLINRKKQ